MRTITILLILVSVQASAGYEAEARTTALVYNWGYTADFPITLYQVGGSYYNKIGTGITLLGGQTNKRGSTVSDYTASAKNFFTLSLSQSARVYKNLHAQVSSTYTEYKSCVVGYGCNPDTSKGYGVALIYNIGKHAVKLSYDNYYEKQKTASILEQTNGYGLSVIYRF